MDRRNFIFGLLIFMIELAHSAARATNETLRRVLHERREPSSRPAPAAWTATEVWVAQNGGAAITARSGIDVAAGTVTLKKINDDDELVDQELPDGTAVTVTAYNMFGEAVAANAYIFIARERGSGKYIVISEDCT